MKTLILLSGIPGCGKSTWTKNYISNHENVFVVESDEIRKRLTGCNHIFDKEKEVWAVFLQELLEYSEREEDLTVIADATNLKNLYRKNYYLSTPKYDKHILVYFDIPFAIAEANNKLRKGDKVVPPDAMKKLEAELEPISDEIRQLYDEIVIVK